MHIGPRLAHPETLSVKLRDGVLAFYNTVDGTPRGLDSPTRIYHRHDREAPSDAIFLDTAAHTVRYIVINGRRVTPGTSSAIVKVSLPRSDTVLAGDVVALFYHTQTGFSTPQIFAEISWMVPSE